MLTDMVSFCSAWHYRPEQHTDTICTNMGLVVISWECERHVNICTRGEALQSAQELCVHSNGWNARKTYTDSAQRSKPVMRKWDKIIHTSANDSRLQQEFYRLLTLFIDVALRSGICPPSVFFPPYVLCGFKSSNPTSSSVSASFSYSDIWS